MQADIEAALEIEVGGQLGGNPRTGSKVIRRGLAQGRVLIMGGALFRVVAPVGGGEVPIPLANGPLATECGLEIVLVDKPRGRVAAWVTVRPGGDGVGDGRQAKVLALLGLAARIGGEGVQAEAVINRQLGVVAQGQQVGLGRTVATVGGATSLFIGLRIGVSVGAGLVVVILAAGVQG